ncbi:MAG: hypothetical protein ABI743_10915 [bacterium]
MIRWGMWVIIIAAIAYGGYTIVTDLIYGTNITKRKGMMENSVSDHPVINDEEAGQKPDAEPEPDYNDGAGAY